MGKYEGVIIAANVISALIGVLMMQTKYRSYTVIERISVSAMICGLALNAAWHLLDRTTTGAIPEMVLSLAILFRMITSSMWRILRKLRSGKCEVRNGMVCAWVTIISLLICGCSGGYSQWDRTHERTYGVTYDADSQSGAVSMTIRPASVASSVPAPASGMNDETIAKIVKIIYEASAKQQAVDILKTPDIGEGNVLSTAGGTPAPR